VAGRPRQGQQAAPPAGAPDLLEAYGAYRQAFELLPQASRADRTPPVLSSRPRELARVTDEAASGAIKAIFADAARAADAGCDQDTAATLRHACAHWLRHSMLTNHANNGVELKTLQATAGHTNIAVTADSLHKTDKEWHDGASERRMARASCKPCAAPGGWLYG
jgi:integrase